MRRRIFIILGISLFVLSLLTGFVAWQGSKIPEQHELMDSAIINAPRDSVYSALVDYKRYPEWREDVERIETLKQSAENPVWKEFDKYGQPMSYTLSENIPSEKVVIRIVDDDLPYKASWEITLGDAGKNTIVRIVERGEITNSILRYMMYHIFGMDSSVKSFLSSLSSKFSN